MSFAAPLGVKWLLNIFGVLFVAQGAAKALDPVGYMAALETFRVLRPLAPVSLGALALSWTVLELLAGVAMLYGGLFRTAGSAGKQLVLGGVMLGLGISAAYLVLDAGALVRHLPIGNCTWFGAYLPQKLSAFVLAQELYVLGMLGWIASWLVSPASAGAPRPISVTSAGRHSRRDWPPPPSRTSGPAVSRG
jgi:hypothetical protein